MPKQFPFYATIRVAIRHSIRAADWDVGMEHIESSVFRNGYKVVAYPLFFLDRGLCPSEETKRLGSKERALKIYWRFVAIFGPRWTPKMGHSYHA